jgi:hypothetical protein
MGIRKIFQKSPSKKEYSNLWIEDGGLLKVRFTDGSYGYVVTFWVFDFFLFTKKKQDAVKIINSKQGISDNDILNLFI